MNRSVDLVRETSRKLPDDYKRMFLANARVIAPIKSGALRRSIVTQVLGRTVKIGWRVPYASAVNEGRHTVPKTVKGRRKDTGQYGVIPAGVYYHKTNSKGFADRIVRQTDRDMRNHLRQRLRG